MSIEKEKMAQKEAKTRNKLEGYRKKLFKEGIYNMPCPYCNNALGDFDVKKTQCIHCGHVFNW